MKETELYWYSQNKSYLQDYNTEIVSFLTYSRDRMLSEQYTVTRAFIKKNVHSWVEWELYYFYQ